MLSPHFFTQNRYINTLKVYPPTYYFFILTLKIKCIKYTLYDYLSYTLPITYTYSYAQFRVCSLLVRYNIIAGPLVKRTYLYNIYYYVYKILYCKYTKT